MSYMLQKSVSDCLHASTNCYNGLLLTSSSHYTQLKRKNEIKSIKSMKSTTDNDDDNDNEGEDEGVELQYIDKKNQ